MEKLTKCAIYYDTVTYMANFYVVYRYNIWHRIWKGFGYIAMGYSKEGAIEQAKKALGGKIELVEIVNI